ncbi:major facilitator superfamily domain-containing protein [Crucibulum laeve]|uniref:Major facilitator superfamily domain-containing protein n=1 Tax=Crucibulum laeve TaxID=68775 RepID=A0A5C3LM72_9AGAR|nr:major facilitator superfamily domain-containing protein [Crucibulum laeve]
MTRTLSIDEKEAPRSSESNAAGLEKSSDSSRSLANRGVEGAGEQQVEGGVKSTPPPASPATGRSTLRSIIIVTTVSFGMVVNTSNSTSVSIALPTIGRELNLDESELQWIISAYPLSSGCLLLVFGRLADLYGRKKTFLGGSFLLAMFTLGCGFANDVLTLDILRGIQGIGAAAMIPASLGILAHAFPPSPARSLAFATFAAGAPVGAVLGNIFGGIMTEYTAKTWRSSFYLQSGFTLICFILGAFSIDPDHPSSELDKRVDWLGAFLVTAGLVLIVFVLGQGEIAPKRWATGYIIALLVVGVLLIGLFILWQWYLEGINAFDNHAARSIWTPPPLLKLSICTRAEGRFAAMLGIAFLNWCSFLSWTFWVQLYYQNYMRYTAMQTVIRLLPMFFSGVLCNVFVGVMAARIPVVYLIGIGTISTSIAGVLFATIIPSASYWAFGFPAGFLSVVGADFVFASGTLFIAKAAYPHEQSVAGALFQTMTQLGTAVGVTVTTVVFNRVTMQKKEGKDNLNSYKAAQWTSFAFAIIALVVGVYFFRGVGVVGHRKDKPEDPERTAANSRQASVSEQEKS